MILPSEKEAIRGHYREIATVWTALLILGLAASWLLGDRAPREIILFAFGVGIGLWGAVLFSETDLGDPLYRIMALLEIAIWYLDDDDKEKRGKLKAALSFLKSASSGEVTSEYDEKIHAEKGELVRRESDHSFDSGEPFI